jgi:hypothetical protein
MTMLPAARRTIAQQSRWTNFALALAAALALAVPTPLVSRAPAAAPDTPSTSAEREEATAAPDAGNESGAGQPVRIELLGGGVLELAAVGEHPSADKAWWAADGSPAAPPYDNFRGAVGVGGDQFVREVAMRWIERLPEGAESQWNIKGSGSAAYGQAFDKNGKRISDVSAWAHSFPSDAKTCTVEISVARGPWETVTETDGESIHSIGTQKYSVAFSPTTERRGQLVLTVSHNITDRDLRVIAVDGDGKTLAVGACTGAGGHGFMQTIAQFSPEKTQGVHKFLVQARDYERYEIRDVSLVPGEKTLPLVVNVQLRNRLELLDKVDAPAIRLRQNSVDRSP